MIQTPAVFVEQLWRYPVKSMGGERLAAAGVSPRTGLDGDRTYAVIDGETGTVVSGKYPRRWGELLHYTARLFDGQLRLVFPDGKKVAERDAAAALTTALGRRVMLTATASARPGYQKLQANGQVTIEHLAEAAPNTFFDYAPLHFITTATLRALQTAAPSSQIDRARFRPNLVIDTGDQSGFVESDWHGKRLAIGDRVVLDVIATCPRGVMTTLAQPNLDADPTILKRFPEVGMYATVVTGGDIRTGDEVRVLS